MLRVCPSANRGNCRPLINECGRGYPLQARKRVRPAPRESGEEIVSGEIVTTVGKEVRDEL